MGRRKRNQKFKPINSIGIAPWIDLPLDLTAEILQRVWTLDILWSAQKVCSTWWNLFKDPSMWRVINIVNPDGPKHTSRDYCTLMCRRAVYRSQGQLTDLSLAYFGDDELLDYIIQRSRHLRRLTLTCCNEITSTALVEAIKRVPELEELHLLSKHIYIRDDDIETIGISCPMLKSFTLNVFWWERRHLMYDWYQLGNLAALAIAKSMPNLQHLRILGNSLDNEGLQAILDRCPFLESLDLRYCFRVDLDGALGIRCEQIQHLRLPSEVISVDDSGGFFFYSSSYYYCSDCGDRNKCWHIEDYELYDYSSSFFDYERDLEDEFDEFLQLDFYSYTGYDIDYYDNHDVILADELLQHWVRRHLL